jgi:hypothetical protein
MMPYFNSGEGILLGMNLVKWCVEVDNIFVRKQGYETAVVSEMGREQAKNVKRVREITVGPEVCE